MTKTLEEIVKECANKNWDRFSDEYDHQTYEQNGSVYATDRSVEKSCEDFKDNFAVEDFCNDYLLENKEFCENVREIVMKTLFNGVE